MKRILLTVLFLLFLTADAFAAGTVTATAYEVIYNSNSVPSSN